MHTPPVIRIKSFYIVLSLLMTLIVALGFWATYFGPFFDGTLSRPGRVHLHAAVYIGWMIIFIAQVCLAAMGKIAWHKKLGSFAVGYAVLLVIVGLYTAVARAALETNEFLGPLMDLVIFAGFFGAAIYLRRKPHLHRKLMIGATTMLLIAAVGRMWFIPLLPQPARMPLFFLIWFLPVFLAIGYDWFFGKQRVHPIYIAGLACFVFRFFSPAYLQETGAWIAIKDAAIAGYLAL